MTNQNMPNQLIVQTNDQSKHAQPTDRANQWPIKTCQTNWVCKPMTNQNIPNQLSVQTNDQSKHPEPERVNQWPIKTYTVCVIV